MASNGGGASGIARTGRIGAGTGSQGSVTIRGADAVGSAPGSWPSVLNRWVRARPTALGRRARGPRDTPHAVDSRLDMGAAPALRALLRPRLARGGRHAPAAAGRDHDRRRIRPGDTRRRLRLPSRRPPGRRDDDSGRPRDHRSRPAARRPARAAAARRRRSRGSGHLRAVHGAHVAQRVLDLVGLQLHQRSVEHHDDRRVDRLARLQPAAGQGLLDEHGPRLGLRPHGLSLGAHLLLATVQPLTGAPFLALYQTFIAFAVALGAAAFARLARQAGLPPLAAALGCATGDGREPALRLRPARRPQGTRHRDARSPPPPLWPPSIRPRSGAGGRWPPSRCRWPHSSPC